MAIELFICMMISSISAQKYEYLEVYLPTGDTKTFLAVDSNKIDSIVNSFGIGSDSVIVVRAYNDSQRNSKFSFSSANFGIYYRLDPCELGSCMRLHLHLREFIPNNDTLLGEGLLRRDTSLITYRAKYRDTIPDGIYFRYINMAFHFQLERTKQVKEGLIDGNCLIYEPYPNKYCDNILVGNSTYVMGDLIESHRFDHFGRILAHRKYRNNVLMELYVFGETVYGLSLAYYYNYHWGDISFDLQDRKIESTSSIYKGVNHGKTYFYGKNGEIVEVEEYKYGELVNRTKLE